MSVAKANNTATAGIALTLLGTLVASAAWLWSLGWPVGMLGVLVLSFGLATLLLGLRRPEPELSIPPAHVTFYQQTKRDIPIPEISYKPAAAMDELEPMGADDFELHRLDVQIRDVTRKINKATVMLGTGKLSDEGFKRYVEDLKSERANLEAARVKIEMSRN